MYSFNIMIVEDDLIASAYLKKICVKNGLNVSYMSDNSEEVLQIVKDKKPDLILMDIMIKGSLSGCEVALQIRAFDKNVVIIFITAYSNDEMIEYALESKAYSYLLKPYRDVEIITTIKMALKEIKYTGVKNNTIMCKNGFNFNVDIDKFYQYDKEIFVSKKLFLLVKFLMKYRGTKVSCEQISYALWDEKRSINTVRALVHRLKEKFPELELHTAYNSEYVLY